MIDSQAQPPGGRRAGCWPSPQSVRRELKSRNPARLRQDWVCSWGSERWEESRCSLRTTPACEVCRPVGQDLCCLPFRSKDIHHPPFLSQQPPPRHSAACAQAHAHWPLYLEVLAQEAFGKLIPLWGKGLKEPSTENC